MTEHDALPEWEFSAWPEDGSDAWDDYPAWDDYSAGRAPSPPATPWYRSPRLLLLLIGLAAAVLVVAAALLVTGRQSGEIPETSRLETRTPTSIAPSRAISTAPRTPPSSTTTPSTAEQPGIEETQVEPVESAPSVAPPPPTPTRSQQGPRINVTRTPMSFTPGKPG